MINNCAVHDADAVAATATKCLRCDTGYYLVKDSENVVNSACVSSCDAASSITSIMFDGSKASS